MSRDVSYRSPVACICLAESLSTLLALPASQILLSLHLATFGPSRVLDFVSYCLPSPLTTLSPSAIPLLFAAFSWWRLSCRLVTLWTRVCVHWWKQQSAPGSLWLVPTDPGEITTKFQIEHLIIINTWTEYKNQIHLPVRTRIYSGRNPLSASIRRLSAVSFGIRGDFLKKWLTLTMTEGRYFRSSGHQWRILPHGH